MTARKITEVQAADSRADQLFDFVADVVKHPPNLAINSLPQDYPHARGLYRMNFFNPRPLAVEHNAME